MDPDTRSFVQTAITLGAVFAGLFLVFAFAATAPGIISNQQRYAAYKDAVSTVLDCRLAAKGRDLDDVCGPVPILDLLHKTKQTTSLTN